MHPSSDGVSIRDLSADASCLGRAFSAYVNQALEVEELSVDAGGYAQTDTTLFGNIIGSLLEAFIAGRSTSGHEVGVLQLARISGVRSMRPVSNIKLSIRPPICGDTNEIVKKRKTRTQRDHVTRTKKPKIAQSKQDVARLQVDDITQQLNLIQMADGFVSYSKHHFMQLPIKNLQLRLQHGTRYMSVDSLVRLLMAQPWRSLMTDALPFRIIRFYESSSSKELQSFIDMIQESMTEYAMARWEKQFWIELPSDLKTSYPDPVDRSFVEQYHKSRVCRKSRLFALANKINTKLDHLIQTNILPSAARHDLGLVHDPRNHVPWIPTQSNMLYDMAIRAARDPCRFYFVFNEFAHSFYEQKYHLAFPKLLTRHVPFDAPPPIGEDFFGDALLSKYWPHQTYDDLLTDATAEWYLYREQLMTIDQEPDLTQHFHARDEFAQCDPAVFEHCRYAYFDRTDKVFLDEPHHPDDPETRFAINTTFATHDIWKDQPITDIQIDEYIQLSSHMDPLLTSIMPLTPLLLSTDNTDLDSILTEDDSTLSASYTMSDLSD